MKAVIFSGGLGSRIAEETSIKPKPMIEIGNRPLLWHIMKIYERHGIKDFIVCLGYKGYVIKEYFLNFYRHTADLTVDLSSDTHQVHISHSENWRVTLVDTGLTTHAGGRLKRVEPYLNNETFCVTYGDGLANIDITAELAFHRQHNAEATVVAVQPPGRFGRFQVEDDYITNFKEKPRGEFGWVNGGFFIFEPQVLNRLERNSGPLEKEFMDGLVRDRQIIAYHHNDFWMSCDTIRDKHELEALWNSGNIPWLEPRE